MDKKKQDPYKQGEVVTWKLWGEMIIKAELGERRVHVPFKNERAEREFYRPQAEHYLGQFPIDYQPKPFPTLSEEEALAMPIKPILAGQALEFNLMLNGSWVQATDRSLVADDALDHPDQVKVIVNPDNPKYTTKEASEKEEREVDATYEKELSQKYGLHCRTRDDIGIPHCFGKSVNPQVSGVAFSLWDDDKVKAISYEPIYGGIKVEWYLHRSNLEHWQKIDAAVWRLINQWNISPFSETNPIENSL